MIGQSAVQELVLAQNNWIDTPPTPYLTIDVQKLPRSQYLIKETRTLNRLKLNREEKNFQFSSIWDLLNLQNVKIKVKKKKLGRSRKHIKIR